MKELTKITGNLARIASYRIRTFKDFGIVKTNYIQAFTKDDVPYMSYWDMSFVTNLESIFCNNATLNSDISDWDY